MRQRQFVRITETGHGQQREQPGLKPDRTQQSGLDVPFVKRAELFVFLFPCLIERVGALRTFEIGPRQQPPQIGMRGMVKNGVSSNKLWPGTRAVRVHIRLLGGKADSVTEIRNVKVEEVE